MFKRSSYIGKTIRKEFGVFLCICLLFFCTACAKGQDIEVATTEEERIEDQTSIAEGVMSYEHVKALEEDAPVVVDVTVTVKEEWNDYKAILKGQDCDGTYRIEGMRCSKEDYDGLFIGSQIRVTGYKAVSAQEQVIKDAEFEILNVENH